jgi:hypothetical protein
MAVAAAIYAIFLTAAPMLASHEVFPPWPPGNPRRVLDIQKMPQTGLPNGGFAYVAKAPNLLAFEDTDPKAQKSPVLLYENDKPLGPARSDHYDVERLGQGRYSHWSDIGILFSASDNSDPRNNRRAYFTVLPDGKR